MAFEPSSWKIYCPDCVQRKIGKTVDGSFSCTKCGCEFTHNWKAWITRGVPMCLLFLFLMLQVTECFSAPRGLIISLVIMGIIVSFLGPDPYLIIKHGDLPKATAGETEPR
jgi:hypothetical protein